MPKRRGKVRTLEVSSDPCGHLASVHRWKTRFLAVAYSALAVAHSALAVAHPVLAAAQPVLAAAHPVLAAAHLVLAAAYPVLAAAYPVLAAAYPVLAAGLPVLVVGLPVLAAPCLALAVEPLWLVRVLQCAEPPRQGHSRALILERNWEIRRTARPAVQQLLHWDRPDRTSPVLFPARAVHGGHSP